jgi:hypothetical protein
MPSRPTLARRVLRFLWRIVRIILMLGAAMAPNAPPPPPPPPPPTEEVAGDGQMHEER